MIQLWTFHQVSVPIEPLHCFVSRWKLGKQIRHGPPWKYLSQGTALTAASWAIDHIRLAIHKLQWLPFPFPFSLSFRPPKEIEGKEKKEVRCSRDPRRNGTNNVRGFTGGVVRVPPEYQPGLGQQRPQCAKIARYRTASFTVPSGTIDPILGTGPLQQPAHRDATNSGPKTGKGL